MRRIVLLSTLTPGRCFTLAETPPDVDEDMENDRLTTAREIIVPEAAWRMVSVEADGIQAESALGDERTFPPTLKVVELPRQGYDRLAARVRGVR